VYTQYILTVIVSNVSIQLNLFGNEQKQYNNYPRAPPKKSSKVISEQ